MNADIISKYTPKLVIPAETSKDQRWFIKFKVWSVDKSDFVYSKDYEINNVPVKERIEFSIHRIDEIQKLLNSGMVKGKVLAKTFEEKEKAKKIINSLSIAKAVEMGLLEKQQMKLKRIRDYEQQHKIFMLWLKAYDYENISAAHFSVDYVKLFGNYLRNVRNCSSRTINNYMTGIATLLNVCVENEYLSSNHFLKWKKEKVGIGKNWAYTPEQQSLIMQHIKNNHPKFEMLIEFLYYTLARPIDLSLLKVGDIGRRHPEQIFFPEQNTKEIMERNIVIPKQLQDSIDRNNLKSYHPDWYVFGHDFKPSPKYCTPKNWGQRYRACVLN